MIWWLFLLFMGSVTAYGQTPDSASSALAAAPAAYAPQYTQADTVKALHKAYSVGRAGGFTLLGVGVGSFMAAQVIASQRPSNFGSYDSVGRLWNGLTMGCAVAVPLEILSGHLLGRHSKRKEQAAIALYEETHTLPPKLQKRLITGRFLQGR